MVLIHEPHSTPQNRISVVADVVGFLLKGQQGCDHPKKAERIVSEQRFTAFKTVISSARFLSMVVILTQCDADGMGRPGHGSIIETARNRIRLNSRELNDTNLHPSVDFGIGRFEPLNMSHLSPGKSGGFQRIQ
jgi:hypothetical protein